MAVVEFKYDDITKLVPVSKEKIMESLANIGAPCEENADGLVVEVTPNRPDFFFIEGIARALNSYLTSKTHTYKTERSKYALISDKSVGAVRPIVRAAVVTGAGLDKNAINYLIEAQEKLHETVGRKRKKVAIGVHNLDVIEFPLIYKAVDNISFIPLGFDTEMTARDILTKHPKGVEYARLISDKIPVICDKRGVISFPPIINSERTKIDENTRNFLIDVTGTHQETVEAVLNMIVCALAERGGTIHEVKINGEGYPNLKPKKMKFDVKFLSKVIGISLKKTDVVKLLNKMDYEVSGGSALVQPYRIDVMHDVDVLEDVVIAYGYNNLQPTIPNFFTSGKANEMTDRIDEILTGMGFSEVKTFTLTNNEKINTSGFTGHPTAVMNPASEDYCVLRPNLLVSMLEVVALNKTKGLPQKIYEVGDVYVSGEINKRLVFVVVDKDVGFSEIRSYLQTFIREFKKGFELKKEKNESSLDAERSGSIYENGKKVGIIGEVKKEILKKFGIEFNVGMCELALENMIDRNDKE